MFATLFARFQPKQLAQASPSDVPIEVPRSDLQMQSLLLTKLPAEIRLSIYRYALGDSSLFMHIVPYDDRSGKVGHCRCKDADSPYPHWQHTCFGWWMTPNKEMVHALQPSKADKLLALPLTCRRIYSEALATLYESNVFDLKGARGVLALHRVVPTSLWRTIRHVYISTIFLSPVDPSRDDHHAFPPEKYGLWAQACRALSDLQGLHSLHIDIIAWHESARNHDDPRPVSNEALFAILGSLKKIDAPVFVVMINKELPDAVRDRLGKVNFTTLIQKRPYHRELFPRL